MLCIWRPDVLFTFCFKSARILSASDAAYSPYSTELIPVTSFKKCHIEAMSNAMTSSRDSCQASTDDSNLWTAKARSWRRWLWWEYCYQNILKKLVEPAHRIKSHDLIAGTRGWNSCENARASILAFAFMLRYFHMQMLSSSACWGTAGNEIAWNDVIDGDNPAPDSVHMLITCASVFWGPVSFKVDVASQTFHLCSMCKDC